jgi:hypothetical protein
MAVIRITAACVPKNFGDLGADIAIDTLRLADDNPVAQR